MALKKVGIEKIVAYVPEGRITTNPTTYQMTDEFLERTVGTRVVSHVPAGETGVEAAKKAFAQFDPDLQKTIRERCRLLVVIGQTLDTNMPHTSAMLHGQLGLANACATFDISLGCTGFVHGLGIVEAFMKSESIDSALMINIELMSRIVDRSDRATGPIFGDAVTATWITNTPTFVRTAAANGTAGDKSVALRCEKGRLFMDGQMVYDFVCRNVPKELTAFLAGHNLSMDKIDAFLFHQASRRTVGSVVDMLRLPAEKVPFEMGKYGNLGACSIPVILKDRLDQNSLKRILVCGFGVGLSWSAAILERQ